MSKVKKDMIEAKGFAIQIYTEDFKNDYISLTDIARYKNVHEPKDVVKNWLRVRDTIEFLGLWETIHHIFQPYFSWFSRRPGRKYLLTGHNPDRRKNILFLVWSTLISFTPTTNKKARPTQIGRASCRERV